MNFIYNENRTKIDKINITFMHPVDSEINNLISALT